MEPTKSELKALYARARAHRGLMAQVAKNLGLSHVAVHQPLAGKSKSARVLAEVQRELKRRAAK